MCCKHVLCMPNCLYGPKQNYIDYNGWGLVCYNYNIFFFSRPKFILTLSFYFVDFYKKKKKLDNNAPIGIDMLKTLSFLFLKKLCNIIP